MAFFESKTGAPLTGNADDAFAGSFSIIPDGTTATAQIKLFEPKEYDGDKFYQITWKIVSDAFKGQEVRQKMATFDVKPEKAQRALNMMMSIYKLCGHSPSHNNAPSLDDLKPMLGKVFGIKIQEWALNGKEGNFVSEVHAADAEFKPAVGVKQERVVVAPKRHTDAEILNLDEDLPFN